MKSEDYSEGYWERGEGSNYVNYADDPGWRPLSLTMRSFHPEGTSVLEVGCAKGFFVGHARAAGFDVRGIDISEYAISKAPEQVKSFVQVANAVEIPFETHSFEVVCSWEFLEHVYLDEINTVLNELYSVLKPGGFMWHKIGISGVSDSEFGGHNHQADITHYNEQPREWWEEKFSDLGMRKVEDAEAVLRTVFSNRDWRDRFFIWQKKV